MRRRTKRALWGVAAVAVVVVAIGLWVFRGALVAFGPSALSGGDAQVEALTLPDGFSVAVYADDVEGARSLALGAGGTVFVGSRDPGKVYALVDDDEDGRADRTLTVASGLDSPNGVAFRDGALYVAEISRVLRYDDIEARLDDPPAPAVVRDDLPDEGHHGWKFIAFGPDGQLYVPVGAPCNVCARDDERFAAILRMPPDGSDVEVFARGVRNTVGFDWHPDTGELWFTDNGRDLMGDDRPPDELNHAPRAGLHFGFPSCHGRVPDPDHRERTCAETRAPEIEFPAHVAPLGMRFYDGDAFGDRYRGGVFVAQHGSWNRTTPIGYRVVFVPFEGGRPGEPETFVDGFRGDRPVAWGRPVDVQVLRDGSLLISDDKSGAVYRVTRS